MSKQAIGIRRARQRCSAPCKKQAGWIVKAAENLVMYLDEQRAATGVVPDDRTIVDREIS